MYSSNDIKFLHLRLIKSCSIGSVKTTAFLTSMCISVGRSVRASHILISAEGHVCLSGLRFSYSMLQSGKRSKVVHDFPENYVNSLLWASPELLEQVFRYLVKSDLFLGKSCVFKDGFCMKKKVVSFKEIPRFAVKKLYVLVSELGRL